MDTNYLCSNGLDMDQLFDKGAGSQAFDMYDTSGVDLGTRFLRGTNDMDTGFHTNKGRDNFIDIGHLLSNSAVTVRRSSGGSWHGSVGGQCNWGAAYAAGFALLDKYDTKKDEFIDVPATEYIGSGISYSRTSWHAFRIYSVFPELTADIDVKFRTTDGGNGTVVMSSIREHSARHKDFVIAGGGGDKGHYGEGVVEISLQVPGIRSIYYKGTFWINSD